MEQSPSFFDPTLFLLFGFMILIYFLMIRPENKRRKTHQEMLASIELGEEIVTAGGILGKVSKIGILWGSKVQKKEKLLMKQVWIA